jgi:hypothetical protein
MRLGLVRSYVHDAVQAYQACTTAIGISTPALDLFALLRAARSGEVIRRGEVVTPNGLCFGYHIHGSGYSFTDQSSGRQINFDVCIINDSPCLRFTVWHLQQYASSIGQDITRDAAQDALGEPDVIQSQLIHVTEAGFDYYCYPATAADT